MGYEDIGAYYLKVDYRFLQDDDEVPIAADEWTLDEGYEYVQEFGGRVFWRHEDHDDPARQASPDDEKLAGHFSGYVLRATRAINDGVDLIDHCDAHSQDVFEYAKTFYEEDGDPVENVWDDAVAAGRDLLVIDEVALHPEHRGKCLGLRIMRRLFDLFGAGCGLAATIPYPLQHLGDQGDMTAFNWHSEKNFQKARRKLAAYLQSLGFSRLGRKNFYTISLAHTMPAEKDLRSKKRSPILVEEKWHAPITGPLS